MSTHINTLQCMFDFIAEALIYYPEVPKGVSPGRDTDLRYDYRCVITTDRPYRSPAALVAHRYGDEFMDELVEISTITPDDIIGELVRTGFKRLPYLDTCEEVSCLGSDATATLLNDVVSMIEMFEDIYCSGRSPKSWIQPIINIATKYYLRWDNRLFITQFMVEPASKPSESIEQDTNRAQQILDHIRDRQQTNGKPSTLVKQVQNMLIQSKEPEMTLYSKPYDNSWIGYDPIEAPVTTLPLPNEPKKRDPFFDKLGQCFTFVTELPNPTLKYGQLIKKEVIYSVDNIDGDVYYVFEVIDDGGYTETVRVLNLEKAIVCEGEQIHYKDFNKVVKTMLARLSK